MPCRRLTPVTSDTRPVGGNDMPRSGQPLTRSRCCSKSCVASSTSCAATPPDAVAAGELRVPLARTFPFEQASAAVEALGQHKPGKLAITMH